MAPRSAQTTGTQVEEPRQSSRGVAADSGSLRGAAAAAMVGGQRAELDGSGIWRVPELTHQVDDLTMTAGGSRPNSPVVAMATVGRFCLLPRKPGFP